MPLTTEEVNKLVEAAVTKAKVEFEKNSKEQNAALKDMFSQKLTQLEETHSAEINKLTTELTESNSELEKYNEKLLKEKIEQIKEINSEYDAKKYDTIEKIDSYIDLYNEVNSLGSQDGSDEKKVPPALKGSKTKLKNEKNSKGKTGNKYDRARKELFDGLSA